MYFETQHSKIFFCKDILTYVAESPKNCVLKREAFHMLIQVFLKN